MLGNIRNRITLKRVTSQGIKTPIAENNHNKQGFFTNLATPVVRTYDRIFSKKNTEEEIQPKPVIGASMFGSSLKEVTREVKLSNLQDRSEKFSLSAAEFSSLAKELAEHTERESASWSLIGMWKGLFGRNESIPYTKLKNPLDKSGEDELVQETGSAFDNINLISSTVNIEGFNFDKELEVQDNDTPSLTSPLVSEEKIGLVQRMKNMLGTFVDCFVSPFRATENSESIRIMYGDTSRSVNGEYVSGDTGINYPSCSGNLFQERSETPPPAYEEATQGLQPSKQLVNPSTQQVLEAAKKDIANSICV